MRIEAHKASEKDGENKNRIEAMVSSCLRPDFLERKKNMDTREKKLKSAQIKKDNKDKGK